MRILFFWVAAFSVLAACGPTEAIVEGGEEAELSDEATSTETGELRRCFCPAPFTCRHSTSPSHMFPRAHAAMLRAGLTDGMLLQTFGDAEASVGTHCPEPGTDNSAATDTTVGATPCARVHALRMEGFAAWYRKPPTFSPAHIHMIWAAAPVMKSSLKSQVNSFLDGRNGLASNGIDTICPITQAEKNAVRAARDGDGGRCVPGGDYCGGNKLAGASNKLYRCTAERDARLIRTCNHGCSVNPGADDSCRCVPHSNYCGEDQITGNPNTLYRCGANGVSRTPIAQCSRGCRVVPGAEDRCN